MIKNYLKIALRNIKKYKGYSFINITGLAVGLACFILITLWVQDELGFDKFHKKKDNLYLLTITHQNGIVDRNVPYALAPLMADEYSEIDGFTRIYEYGNQVQSFFKYRPDNGPMVIFNESNIDLVDKHFFSMFSFPFIKGTAGNALKVQNSVVISEDIAEKYFGNDNPMGKILNLNNQRNLTVTGVIHIPDNSHLQPDFIIPLQQGLENDWTWRDPSYVLLSQKTNLLQFKDKIAGFMNKKMPYNSRMSFQLGLLPITKVHLGFGGKTYVTIFFLVAVFILLIACTNYTNLATARSANRTREVGLRKVAGARKGQLIKQFLTESVLTSLVSFLFSLILVWLFLPLLNNLTNKQLSFYLIQNYSMILFLLPVILLVGILAGIYPAFFLTRLKPVDSLKGSGEKVGRRSRFRIVSVVGQFAISVILIMCMVIIFKQLNFVKNRPLGFSTDNVIKIPINKSLLPELKKYKNILAQNPGVLQVTAGQSVPYNEDYKTSGIKWDGKDPQLTAMVRYSISYFNYLETFGMKITDGRSFRYNNAADINKYIINEKAAEYMGMKNPVGKRLSFHGIEGIIIGVVKNYHHVPLHREIMPQVFTVHPRHWNALRYIFIKIAPQNIPQTLQFIRKETTALAPQYPFSYSFLDQEMNKLYQSEQKMGQMIGYFAFLAIFISCLGLFGLASFMSEKRTKEIGVRKVLGASISGIVVLLNKQFIKWVLLANIFAWPLAYYVMSNWLKSFAYKTNIGIWVFLSASLIALIIALFTVSYQAIRVAMAHPVDSLRYE